jgi:hypothetical protein
MLGTVTVSGSRCSRSLAIVYSPGLNEDRQLTGLQFFEAGFAPVHPYEIVIVS